MLYEKKNLVEYAEINGYEMKLLKFVPKMYQTFTFGFVYEVFLRFIHLK